MINVVPGDGPNTGAAIVKHPGVDKIAFTGSCEVGQTIMREAASTLKRVTLELGGKSPNIIFADADLDTAIAQSHNALYWNQGQVCASGSRLFVEDKVYDQVVEKIAERNRKYKVGDPFDPETEQGPQVDRAQFDKMMGYIRLGREQGAECVTGGKRWGERGYFIEPTLFANVKDEMKIAREEIFGPVLCALRFSDLDEVVQRANNTTFGLAAGRLDPGHQEGPLPGRQDQGRHGLDQLLLRPGHRRAPSAATRCPASAASSAKKASWPTPNSRRSPSTSREVRGYDSARGSPLPLREPAAGRRNLSILAARHFPKRAADEAVRAGRVVIVDREEGAVGKLHRHRVAQVGIDDLAGLSVRGPAIHAEDDLVVEVPRLALIVAQAGADAPRRPAVPVRHQQAAVPQGQQVLRIAPDLSLDDRPPGPAAIRGADDPGKPVEIHPGREDPVLLRDHAHEGLVVPDVVHRAFDVQRVRRLAHLFPGFPVVARPVRRQGLKRGGPALNLREVGLDHAPKTAIHDVPLLVLHAAFRAEDRSIQGRAPRAAVVAGRRHAVGRKEQDRPVRHLEDARIAVVHVGPVQHGDARLPPAPAVGRAAQADFSRPLDAVDRAFPVDDGQIAALQDAAPGNAKCLSGSWTIVTWSVASHRATFWPAVVPCAPSDGTNRNP